MALSHAQFLSLPVHLLCKGGIAAGKLHSSCSGSIIARGQQHAITEGTLGHNVPVYQPMEEPSTWIASLSTGKGVSRSPLSRQSSVVMILVVLAIGRC